VAKWGDYDNDSDLDIFISGTDFSGNPFTGYIKIILITALPQSIIHLKFTSTVLPNSAIMIMILTLTFFCLATLTMWSLLFIKIQVMTSSLKFHLSRITDTIMLNGWIMIMMNYLTYYWLK